MSCKDYEHLLDSFLINEIGKNELSKLQEHANCCQECRLLMNTSALIDENVQNIGSADESYWSEFDCKLASRIAGNSIEKQSIWQRLTALLGSPRWRPAFITAALTACFLTCNPDTPKELTTLSKATSTAVASSATGQAKNDNKLPKMKTFSAQNDKGDELMAMSFSVGNVEIYWVFNEDA